MILRLERERFFDNDQLVYCQVLVVSVRATYHCSTRSKTTMKHEIVFLLLILGILESAEARHVTVPAFEPLPYRRNRRRRQIGRYAPTYFSTTTNSPPFTILNLTCSFISQPLNHFDLPQNSSGTYQQRYCYYDGFKKTRSNTVGKRTEDAAPIFLYVGNESPIETYINHTGLMWELAPHFGAVVVFLEHRYEGESIPDPSTTLPPVGKGCMAYSSSIQALADASYFIQNVLFTSDTNFSDPIQPSISSLHRRPVIAFGGSYGGMLVAWLRMKYPSMVAGAISASAPIWGLPLAMTSFESSMTTVIDSASHIIAYGLTQSYPPAGKNNFNDKNTSSDKGNNNTNHCPSNLLAVWPLIKVLSKYEVGRKLLEDSFLLCKKLSNETNPDDIAQSLIEWAQSPWFNLAEGSYPYPSSYISYALTHEAGINLPAWPVQSACWQNSTLHQDIGIHFEGNRSTIQYSITYGESDLILHVDWDTVTIALPRNVRSFEELLTTQSRSSVNNTLSKLLTNVRAAVGVWYNASLSLKCFDVDFVAPNSELCDKVVIDATTNSTSTIEMERMLYQQQGYDKTICDKKIKQEGSWPSLNCNEEMNLIVTYANGLGNDVFWPPSVPRTVRTYSQLLNVTPVVEACIDIDGMFGYPQQNPDPWSSWYDIVYGGRHILNFASNIVFSNGKLDPWSAAGVAIDPSTHRSQHNSLIRNISTYSYMPGLTVHHLTSTVIAVTMDSGGHHTDLMYANELDPPCVTYARQIERENIDSWIKSFGHTEP